MSYNRSDYLTDETEQGRRVAIWLHMTASLDAALHMWEQAQR